MREPPDWPGPEEWLHEIEGEVYRLVGCVLAWQTDWEDGAQEVLKELVVMLRSKGGDPTKIFHKSTEENWILWTAVKRGRRTWINKQNKRLTQIDNEVEAFQQDFWKEYERSNDVSELISKVIQQGCLNQEEEKIIQMRRLGWDNKEISEVIGLEIKKVKKRYSSGLKKIRRYLKNIDRENFREIIKMHPR